ncbi:hypothetical protein PPS11_21199 [Pseudomonas putida S11]|nr:hypothetical protein PPS11_21199 [Pseudomonas putida S11]
MSISGRQRRQLVVETVQHQSIGSLRAGQYYRDQRAQHRQIVVPQYPVTRCGCLCAAADQTGTGQKDAGAKAEAQQFAAVHLPALSG